MLREKLKQLLRPCRRWLSLPLPLSGAEWLAVGTVCALLLGCVSLLFLLIKAPGPALQSFWKLKLAGIGWVHFLDPEFSLPDGRSLRASVLLSDPGSLQSASQLIPYLEQIKRDLVLLFPFGTLFLGGVWSGSKGHTASAGEHIRGRRLVGAKALASGLAHEPGLLPLGPVLLPRQYEGRHLLVAGGEKARDAVLIRQLEAIRRAALPAVVHDPTGALLARFYRPGVDHIANPFDERGLDWNLFHDLESLAGLAAFADSLIPCNAAAQDLLRGMVAALQLQGRQSHADLWEALGLPVQKLARLCASVEQGAAGLRVLEDPHGRQAEQALAQLRSQLSWLEFARREGSFSVRNWLADPGDSFIFLASHPELERTLRPYHSLLADLFGRWLFTVPARPEARLFFLLDDLAGLQPLPGIKRLLNRGGVQGASVILGVRDLASLRSRYRSEDVEAILNGCGTLLVLQLPDEASADYFSRRFGDSQYWDSLDPSSVGAGGGSGHLPWALAPRTERLLLASQFMELPEGVGYLLVPSLNPAQVRLAFSEADRAPVSGQGFLLRRGCSLGDLTAREPCCSGRDQGLGPAAFPECPGVAAGLPAAATGRKLDLKRVF